MGKVTSNFNEKPVVSLNDGKFIPRLGLGTWQLDDEEAMQAVRHAISIGVRHIDTAAIYNNEQAVGRAISDHGVSREEVFITTKVWNDSQGYDNTISACKESLKQLNMDYLDLFLVHWPATSKRVETYKALETLRADGFVKSIGVSNFMVKHLEELLEATSVVPAINQIEMHPFNYKQRYDVIDFCNKNNIAIEAYSPLAQGQGLRYEIVKNIAASHSCSPSQVLIRWSLQHNFIVIPRSANPDHIDQNFNVQHIKLSNKDMQLLDDLNENLVTTMDPDTM